MDYCVCYLIQNSQNSPKSRPQDSSPAAAHTLLQAHTHYLLAATQVL
jgi:hypothetical protein